MLTSLKVTTCTSATNRELPVHVPDPRVAQLQIEVGAAVGLLDLEVHLVGQIEAALGLDDVLEHRQDVAVLAIELELDLGLVPLEVLAAHAAYELGRGCHGEGVYARVSERESRPEQRFRPAFP